MKESYAESYWKRDYIGTSYQTYLDIVNDIESLNLTTEQQQIEIERVKSKRMKALIDYGYTQKDLERQKMPPWSWK